MSERSARTATRRRRRKKSGVRFSDLFYGALGTGILTHETVVSQTAEWPLIFASFFLLGLIPISRADSSGLSIRDILVLALQANGQQLPEIDHKSHTAPEEAKPSDPDDPDSQ